MIELNNKTNLGKDGRRNSKKHRSDKRQY
jgi:hypothetical protein